MARFVEFRNVIGKTVWINPDCVVGVTQSDIDEHTVAIVGGVTQSDIDEHTVAIVGADGENPWFVLGTVDEVLAKLQGNGSDEIQPTASRKRGK